ncbi:MAG TPA: hemerythrin domain-containing protein [Albitalea sp.]|nr:hemerythrin domain-containing protein [Albitalea sp.]
MLAACHDRVRRSLALLLRLREHVALNGADERAREAAADVLRYFTLAAPAHHEDEERHVVPALRALGDERSLSTAQRLLDEHGVIRDAWAALQPLLEQVALGRTPARSEFDTASQRFADLHDGHLLLEESIAFPSAEAYVAGQGAPAIAAVGAEMAARRMTGATAVRRPRADFS